MKCQKCERKVDHPQMSKGIHGYGWECRCGWFNRKPKQVQKPKVVVVDKNNYNQCQKCAKIVAHPAQSKGIHGYGWECSCGWFNRKPKQVQKPKQAQKQYNKNRVYKESFAHCPLCGSRKFTIGINNVREEFNIQRKALHLLQRKNRHSYKNKRLAANAEKEYQKQLGLLYDNESNSPIIWQQLQCKQCKNLWKSYT